jgi:ABC-2 type transport system permease protein
MPIFDQGYQHWSGQLSPHAWRWLAITRHGIRLGMQNRILRILILLAWLPAVVLGFVLCVWGLIERKSEMIAPILDWLPFTPQMLADPISYRKEAWTLSFDYFLLTELRFSMILVLIVGPGLISQDLRFNALPLYFSRPVRRIDYFLGKLGIVSYFLGMVLIVPSLIAYVLGLVFSLDLTIIRDTYRMLFASIGYGILMTLSISLLILALSSLSRYSRYIALLWVGVWFVSGIAAMVLFLVNEEQRSMAQRENQAQQMQYRNLPPRTPEEFAKEQEAQREQQRRWEEMRAEELRRKQRDWRPMISYTENLSRVGTQMLGTDACWERLAQDEQPEHRQPFLDEHLGPRYPWYWSAVVLAVLFGLSICILNFRVKSLDRLR